MNKGRIRHIDDRAAKLRRLALIERGPLSTPLEKDKAWELAERARVDAANANAHRSASRTKRPTPRSAGFAEGIEGEDDE